MSDYLFLLQFFFFFRVCEGLCKEEMSWMGQKRGRWRMSIRRNIIGSSIKSSTGARTSIGSKLNFDLDSSNFPLTHGRPSRLARIERPGNFCREASDTKEDSDHLIDYDDTPSQLSTLRFLAISNPLLSFEGEKRKEKKEALLFYFPAAHSISLKL